MTTRAAVGKGGQLRDDLLAGRRGRRGWLAAGIVQQATRLRTEPEGSGAETYRTEGKLPRKGQIREALSA